MKKLIKLMAMTIIITSCDEVILLEGASNIETRNNLPQTIECFERTLYLFGNDIGYQGNYGHCEAINSAPPESEEVVEEGEGEETERSRLRSPDRRVEAARGSIRIFYTPNEVGFEGIDYCGSNGGSQISADYTDPDNPRCYIDTYTL